MKLSILRSSKGNEPARRAYSKTPMAHTSTSGPKYCLPKTSSGAAGKLNFVTQNWGYVDLFVQLAHFSL
ncbi:hypothetical protein NQ318_004462 [Aromia moschata]|uniref:Uncharacterized protein n=1 Tax=Aromia moschata TaxID=1265417 RepID=A0AAV8YCN3_9CUCU|nr:hypothetical protein NQ318_004462 [Aromia moschata]